ncbi:hypothetical protein Vafri_17865 [Volvox africanus]|nr:hypothetical protein Vafri_17865 [Volvox africanus]
MAVSIPRPWKHVVFESVMYESMSTDHANDVAQQSPTMNGSNLQRPVLQSRRSLLSRVTTSQTGMEANNFQPKSSKYQAPDDSNTPHGCMAVPAVILYFQIHLQRPSQPSSYPQSPDTEGILPETTGSVWPFSPFSALSADSSIHGVMNSAVLSAPQSNAMTFPPPSCDSSLHPPAETGLPDAAACERSTRRAGNNTTGRGPGPGMQQLHRQHSRTSRITQQHQRSPAQGGGSIIRPAAARCKLAASAPADAYGKNGEVATSSASITAAAKSGEAGFRAALVGAAAAAEMTFATVITAGEEGSLLETSFLRHHCSSSLSKSIADYFREREGMVLSGLTPVVTAFGGPGCMEVLYQNATSILYFGLRAQPKTNSNGCAVTKAQEGDSSSGSSTLAELFSFEPSKLERLLNDVLSEGRVWRGIVQVPATCHPRLTRLQRAQQAMTNPTTKLISSGAPSSTARHTTTHYSSSLIQTVTHLPISTAVPAPMNHPEPVTQQQSSALPHVSIGVQMSKSSPHLQGFDAAIAQALSAKEAAGAVMSDSPASPFISPLLPVWPPAEAPAVTTMLAPTQVSMVADFAGSIENIVLSTMDGITLATAMATDDVDPQKKALGNSEMDPLATSIWGLMIDTPEQHLTTATTHEVSHRSATKRISGFVSAMGVPYKSKKGNSGANTTAAATAATASRQSICKASSSRTIREKIDCSDANGSILPFLLSPAAPPQEGCSSIAAIVASSVGKRDAAAATANKRQPQPVALVSRCSHQPSSSRLDDPTIDTARNGSGSGRAGDGGGCLDSNMAGASFTVMDRILSMVERDTHLRASCSIGGPRQCHSRADQGPADFSGRTVPRVLTFASTLRSTPSAAQAAFQAAMASSPSVSSRWSVVEPPRPPPSASRLPFRDPKSSASNGLKEFMKQQDERLGIKPNISCHISDRFPEGAGELRAAESTAMAFLDSEKVHTAGAGGGCDGGYDSGSCTATVRGVLHNEHQDDGNNEEAAVMGGRPVTKERVTDMMKSCSLRGDGDIDGDSAAVFGDTITAKDHSIPTAASAPPAALQVMTAAGTCWHEICASRTTDPLTGQYALIITQTDVTGKVEAERHLAFVMEAEHRLLEQIFPRHVLAYMTEEGGPWAVPSAPDINPIATTNASIMQTTTKTPVTPDTTSGYWRPMVRDINKLATSHEQVTLLFADIQGFTPMCKVLEPRVVMAFLNDLFTRFDSRLDEFGVYKVETIGDCYFVAGGLICQDEHGMPAVRALGEPADPQHAEQVFSFAKAMLEAASGMSLPTTSEAIKMRIGLHSGPVVSGVVGQRMPRFCLFGDTVNTASRMESTGVPGCIHVSEATRNLLGGEDWVPTGGIEVKGKGLMNTYLWTPPNQKSENASAAPAAKKKAAVTTTTAAAVVTTAAAAAVVTTATAAAAVATATTTTAAVTAAAAASSHGSGGDNIGGINDVVVAA